MMMRRLLSLFAILGLILVVSPAPAFAAGSFNDPFKDACSKGGGSGSASVCATTQDTNPLTGKDGLLLKVSRVVALIAGAAAVIIIFVSSLQFITSNGDKNAQTKARNGVISALVGLVIIAMSQAIITFVLNRI